MRLTTKMTSTPLAMLSVLLMTVGFAGFANAAPVDVYLQVQSFNKVLPDTSEVPMWGYASCPDNTFTGCVVSAPGPQIKAIAGDTLNIHVQNTLNVPVSVVIPGQTEASDGVPTMMASAPNRVRSFTSETEAGTGGAAGATTTYTWASLNAGTYLYQSGTFPSIEVPMGLYGALVVADAIAGEAYGHPIDAEAVLLLSEIDPIQNARVAAAATALPSTDCVPMADYEQLMTAGYPCTVDYSPMYFLVNGAATVSLPAGDPLDGNPTNTALLRFLNAGLRSHTPSIVGVELGLIAEDGNAYPGQQRNQSAVLLAAGKTIDALIATPDADQSFSLFDRMPTFSNENLPNGGSFATLQVGAGTPDVPPPTSLALDDPYSVVEDMPLVVSAANGLLNNDAGSLINATAVSGVSHGTLECVVGDPLTTPVCADGSFTYTPNDDFSGSDSFTYSASDGTNSYGAQVTLQVSFVNDDPVATADTYVNNIGSTISVPAPGVLGNDMDADGDALTVTPIASGGLTLNADGSFEYTGGTPGAPFVFSYTATDGAASSSADVTLNFNPVPGIALIVQEPGGAPVSDYRWTVEEDTTWHPDPSNPAGPSLATDFHKSYMPVVAQGCVGATACSTGETQTAFTSVALDPSKHYYVSVLPADAMDENASGERLGHSVGGAQIPPGVTSVTVNVNKEPLPYAQISIFIFDDSSPTNGAVDLNEKGLGGFQITLEDAGGRYGISAGAMSQDADGNPLTNALDCFGGTTMLPGIILSCPDTQANRDAGLVGRVLVKNLFPAKYGIITTAPDGMVDTAGDPIQWVQTSTIEGTKVIDAWVKAGEPPFFSEFGPVGVHAFVGFVSPELTNAKRTVGANTVSGAVTNYHMSRPPNQVLADSGTYDALMHTRPWIGLNSSGGIGPSIAAVQADIDDATGTATFNIPNVPDGDYQLVIWDSYLDQVIAYRSVSFPDKPIPTHDGTGNVGNVPVFQWFARMENHVFLDANGNGKREAGEAPLAEQAVNLRWRDGSVYQSFPTDLEGFVPFDQVFPFFNWLVAEVDYARFEATGLTVTVDHGGDVSTTGNVYNPQIQAGGATSRTEIGQVLTQGFQGFLGQTSVFEWGKRPYAPGVNGGISGIVYYGVTRAESDPRLAAAEPWEPGIARVPVRLYRVVQTEGGGTALALVQETVTDSWDDSLPSGCPGADPTDVNIVGLGPDDAPGASVTTKCYDGLRNFNQARPAVFDGGYAFNDIPAGEYVVEVVPPPGYELMKEEDINVTSGDGYASVFVPAPAGPAVPLVLPGYAMVAEAMAPEPGLAQPPCVGELRMVPDTLSLFPKRNEEAPFRRAMRPLCDRKHVMLSDQGQAAADFTLMTDAPIAAHYTGMVLDDVAQEFNPLSPQFGEKWAPPFVPVSIRDHNGEEISRVYSDQWGRINGLMPSTFTAYIPSPSGFSPAMHMTCMNDPGPIPGPDGALIVDPQYNPAYSNFCYTFQYMPGTTTYLDTPVLPVSAFASGYNPPDCSLDTGTPMIRQVDGTGAGPLVDRNGLLTITSLGTAVDVPNPAYEGPIATGLAGMKNIQRDFGFGISQGTGSVTISGKEVTIVSWSADQIVAQVVNPTNSRIRIRTGQLVVTRDNGNSSESAITVTVSRETPIRVVAGGSIQAAIDSAAPGKLIIVEPGVYNESVIMWKPVRLQGSGAGSTIINAVKRPTETLIAWRAKMDSLFGIGGGQKVVDSLPNQLDGAAGYAVSEGAAITVLGVFDPERKDRNSFSRRSSRIDGFSITGADVGGGILVNSNAHRLVVSNNNVFGNNGSYNGGIRIGQPFLELPSLDALPSEDKGTYRFNTNVRILFNSITRNGGLGGAGGGISLNTGSDGYDVRSNFVCGNFTTGDGGGIGHLGISNAGRIYSNTIVRNQSFNQAIQVSGGGLFIGGERAVPDLVERDNLATLSDGTGSVTVRFNRIQGNQAGAGHGGGIRTQFVNGLDVDLTGDTKKWATIRIMDNTIVNNVAGYSGGGISLHDTVRGIIRRNTIAHNDSTATTGPLIGPGTGAVLDHLSANQPAGVATEPHSETLRLAMAERKPVNDRLFSTPAMNGNTVWQNRSFHYAIDNTVAVLWPRLDQNTVGECPAGAEFWDIDQRILGAPTSGGTTTTSAPDPGFVNPYCNGGRSLATPPPGPMFALPALDEGGNAWIDVRYGPLTQTWPDTAAPFSYDVVTP